jgi:chemotaxis signal transduction protein
MATTNKITKAVVEAVDVAEDVVVAAEDEAADITRVDSKIIKDKEGKDRGISNRTHKVLWKPEDKWPILQHHQILSQLELLLVAWLRCA